MRSFGIVRSPKFRVLSLPKLPKTSCTIMHSILVPLTVAKMKRMVFGTYIHIYVGTHDVFDKSALIK